MSESAFLQAVMGYATQGAVLCLFEFNYQKTIGLLLLSFNKLSTILSRKKPLSKIIGWLSQGLALLWNKVLHMGLKLTFQNDQQDGLSQGHREQLRQMEVSRSWLALTSRTCGVNGTLRSRPNVGHRTQIVVLFPWWVIKPKLSIAAQRWLILGTKEK